LKGAGDLFHALAARIRGYDSRDDVIRKQHKRIMSLEDALYRKKN